MPGTPHITSPGLGEPDRAERGASSSAGSTLPRQTALQCSGKTSPGNRTRSLRNSPKPRCTSSTTLLFKNFIYSLVTAQRGIHQEPDPAGCHHLPLDLIAATEGAWEALHGAQSTEEMFLATSCSVRWKHLTDPPSLCYLSNITLPAISNIKGPFALGHLPRVQNKWKHFDVI